MKMTQPMSGTEFLARTSRQSFTTAGFAPVGNEARAAAERDRRLSSAAAKHDSRPNRLRSRGDAKRHAIKSGW